MIPKAGLKGHLNVSRASGVAQHVMRTTKWAFELPMREADSWRCEYLAGRPPGLRFVAAFEWPRSFEERVEWITAINAAPSELLAEACHALQVQRQEGIEVAQGLEGGRRRGIFTNGSSSLRRSAARVGGHRTSILVGISRVSAALLTRFRVCRFMFDLVDGFSPLRSFRRLLEPKGAGRSRRRDWTSWRGASRQCQRTRL